MEELNDSNDKQFWQLEDLRKDREIADAVHVRTKWVLCNKGDEANPDMRARLVACEVNKQVGRMRVVHLPHLASRRTCFARGMQAGVNKYCPMDRLCRYVSMLLT